MELEMVVNLVVAVGKFGAENTEEVVVERVEIGFEQIVVVVGFGSSVGGMKDCLNQESRMSLHKFYKKKEDSEQQHKYTKVDLNSLPVDPFERPSIEFYHVNQRDEIRRVYLQKWPFQPLNHKFPPHDFGGKPRRFIQSWFDDNKYWLEYSIKEDAAFCLCCYLFKSSIPNQGGSDHFVKSGFKAWNRKSGIDNHKEGTPYYCCPNVSKFDETKTIHRWLADRCDVVDRVVLKNAPKNAQMKCGEIQKDIVQAFSDVILNVIIGELGNDFFAVLVDESRDVSCKEQMALVLRFVNRKVSRLLNIIGSSYKRRDKLRKKQADKVMAALAEGELQSGTGLNQEVDLGEFDSDRDHRAETIRILKWLKSFDFVFCLHFMVDILGVTDHLNTILQRKDQDIVNAMNQVSSSKKAIQEIRDVGWGPLLEKVTLFCAKNEVKVVDLEYDYFNGYSRRRGSQVNNLHHYQVDVFKEVIDMQLQELNNHFNEVNSNLLLCIACLCPSESFKTFDLEKIMKMATLYPEEYPTKYYLRVLEVELGNYIKDVQEDERFADLKSIGDLAKKMVEEKKHIIFPKIYLLVKFAWILPVATASVEHAFSAMKLIKTDIRNKMSDQFLSDSLVSYIEKNVLKDIDNDAIVNMFQDIRPRRVQL
ncbi:uncharacterized protein LOC111888627 [Lactuca sativa]|uniref:uncharacterized protein LOC111888627 n=1 Tax=Lactuca sativa TaxID=4236 RepID=UPI0022AF30E4|nr:uncharacterized protein LOC111888627 [Lactuca sativa]